MTITRIGTNEKYQAGWASAFGKAKPSKSAAKKAAPKKKASPKKTAKKGKK